MPATAGNGFPAGASTTVAVGVPATRQDVPDIVRLLANDPLGAKRERYEDPLPSNYYAAFDAIQADKNNFLMVAEMDNKVVGTLQLSYITYLTYQGGKRAFIEGVRTDNDYRGKGIGKELVNWAITKARTDGCHVVQLTTDKQRPDAVAFYQKLGFVASHEGLKLFF